MSARAAATGQQLDDGVVPAVRCRRDPQGRSARPGRRPRARSAYRARPAARRARALRAASGRSPRTPTERRRPTLARTGQRSVGSSTYERSDTRAAMSGGHARSGASRSIGGCVRFSPTISSRLSGHARRDLVHERRDQRSTCRRWKIEPTKRIIGSLATRLIGRAAARLAGAGASCRAGSPAPSSAGMPRCRTISSRENARVGQHEPRAARRPGGQRAAARAFAAARTTPGARRTTRRGW